jgi:ATP-dependent helicase/nuclease subunit B
MNQAAHRFGQTDGAGFQRSGRNREVMTNSTRPKPSLIFFDWSRPPLIVAAEWLVENFARDLTRPRPILVLPTTRACRRINDLCGEVAGAAGLSSLRFDTITVGDLPERMYEQEKATASPLLRNLAWIEALRLLPEEKLNAVFPGLQRDEVARMSSVAARLQALHERLGADIWSFKSVAREIALQPEFPQNDRWQALADLQDLYYKYLSSEDLWDPQAARNVAIRRELCRTNREIVLIGLADLNRGPREMLMQCASKVTSLVFCDPNDRAGFDDIGCLVTEYWTSRRIRVSDRRIRMVDRPADQARLVGEFLESCRSQFSNNQMVIGLPDETVWPQVERVTSRMGLPTYHARGMLLREGAVIRLLQKIAEYVDESSFTAFAEVIRHPDIYQWISSRLGRNNWLSEVDAFQNEVLPATIDLRKPRQFAGMGLDKYPVVPIVEALRELLEKVLPESRSLNAWAEGWISLLFAVYGAEPELSAEVAYDRMAAIGVQQVTRLLTEISESSKASLAVDSATDSLEVCLRFFDEQYLDEREADDAVSVLGWLDLALEDAPAMIVTGVNNHVVPTNESGHAFLPNSLCLRFGLVDNQRRMARDVYAVSLMDACRANLLFVVGRRNSRKEPIQISRLLLHCDDDALVRRSQAFFSFDDYNQRTDRGESKMAQRPALQQLIVPRPSNVVVPSQLSVTRFREYMKCPYRFYLTTILKLEEVDDALRELDGGMFGDLAHRVFEDFGRSEVRKSGDANEIRDFLRDRLAERSKVWKSRSQLPSLTLQIENLEYRLERFAELQAEHRRAGWTIVEVEQKVTFPFVVDGQPFPVTGIIDRIDQHEDGRLAVWDYKTSDSGKTAMAAHMDSQGNWLDLQLPLYRHLITSVRTVPEPDQVGLGYILLPNNTSNVKFDPASWTPEQLRMADEQAWTVMRSIRAEIFWPPAIDAPQFSDATSSICQDNVFERWAEVST